MASRDDILRSFKSAIFDEQRVLKVDVWALRVSFLVGRGRSPIRWPILVHALMPQSPR